MSVINTNPLLWAVLGFALALCPSAVMACELVDAYIARLSARDHHNSRGERLVTVAAIVRQDRANYHEIGLRDVEDSSDGYFSLRSNRDALEGMLARGSTGGQVAEQILNGTPVILVRVCSDPFGNSVDVAILPRR